jgi:hypothetical protein
MGVSGGLSSPFRFFTRPFNLGAIGATLAAAAMLVAVTTPVVDPDVWWVAAAGRRLLVEGAVPRTNVFSYVEPEHSWIMHEWLLGPPYAVVLARLGPAGFDLIAGCALLSELGLLAAATVMRTRRLAVGLAAFGAAVALYGGRFVTARPTGISLVFALGFAILAFAPRFSLTSMATAIVIELVWANAHGSFPLGVAMLLVAAAEHRRDRVLRIVAAVLSSVATLVTPYGLALHRFVLGYFAGNAGIYHSIHTHIAEFGPVWRAPVTPLDVIGLAVDAAVIAAATRSRRYRLRAGFCLGLWVLAVLHYRNLEFAGLLSVVLLVPYLDDAADDVARARAAAPDLRPRIITSALVILPACLVGMGAFCVAFSRRQPSEWVNDGPAFMTAMRAVPDGARAFVPFQRAGIAIWYGAPRGVRVFFDSRNDCYSPATFDAFVSLTLPGPPQGWRATLDSSGTDTALLSRSDPLDGFLSTEPGWTRLAAEGNWRVYHRALSR